MEKNTMRYWDRKSRLIWTTVLFFGCLLVYSTRTTMSICAVQIAKELGWDKRISGFVMSAFFFGYILTQILGGMFADRYGGDRSIYIAACIWSIATAVTPFIGGVLMLPDTLGIALAQAVAGIAQGVHFPSLASLLSDKIADEHRNTAYSFASSGTVLGALLTGSVGSIILEYFDWQTVFLCFGGISIFWAIVVRFLMSMEEIKESSQNFASNNNGVKLSMQGNNVTDADDVTCVVKDVADVMQWKKIVTYKSFWALFITTFCESFVFTNLLSWLPTYFREKYPKSEPWVYNVFPWISTFISSNLCGILSDRMVTAGISLTKIRKLFVSLSLFTTALLCLALTQVHTFLLALVIVTSIICFLGCNSSGIGMNPQDLLPKNAGALYGIMNTGAAISGMAGVSLTGHILQSTQDWSNVFLLISTVSSSGGLIFLLFGSGQRIA